MQVGVLGKGIVACGCHFAKYFRYLRKCTTAVASHSLHIEGIAAGRTVGRGLEVLPEVFHGFAVFAVVVVRAAFDAVHLGGVGFFGPGGEVVLRHDFRLVVVAAQQVDFGYIIRY